MADKLDLGMVLKANQESFEDEFFSGTPDLILPDEVIDIKNSWSSDTFPLFADEITNNLYRTQLQVYMHLTKKPKARLVYVLSNTPNYLVVEDIKWRTLDLRKNGNTLDDEELAELAQETMAKHNYDNIETKYRIKTFCLDYDPLAIEELQSRVEGAREYLKTIII